MNSQGLSTKATHTVRRLAVATLILTLASSGFAATAAWASRGQSAGTSTGNRSATVPTGVQGRGTVAPASGGKTTEFVFQASDLERSASGSALLLTPLGKFKSQKVRHLSFSGSVAHVVMVGHWNGDPGHRLNITATDGSPDSVRFVVSKGGTDQFSVDGPLLTGVIIIT